MRPTVRLLSLTGSGGIGKTRLSLEVSRAAQSAFPDGVVFVPLAPIRDPALVIPTIAQRLGLPDQASRIPHTGLTMYLRERAMLLLLDNFEQVVAAAPEVERLLAVCPALKLIVTSRVSLQVAGEHEFQVPPLPVPETGVSRAASLERVAAVKLFIDRSRSANPGLAIDGDDRVTIARICRYLGGLPLAIELAAVMSKSLSPERMLEQLERRLPPAREGREGLPRQLTIGDTISWSYEVLDPDAQRLFLWLSVFTGGFAPEAADALCAHLCVDGSICIQTLTDHLLVRRVDRPGQPLRLRLQETVREFAVEWLINSGELQLARRWHSGYCAELAVEAEQRLMGSEQREWLDRMETEHDNLRAAIEVALETGDGTAALNIGAGIWRFWERRGHVSEGLPLMERIVALPSAQERTRARASALFGLGRLRYVQGQFEPARDVFLELAEVAEELRASNWLSAAYTQLSHLATREGDYLEARRLAEDGLVLRRKNGDHWAAAVSLLVLGRNAFNLGDDLRAVQLTEEGIDIFRRLEDRHGMSDGYDDLAEFALRRGKYAIARGHLEEALTLHQELGDEMAIADSLALLGHIAIGQRNYLGARSLFTRSLTTLIDLGARWRIDPALEGLAEVVLEEGDPERAVHILAAADRMRTDLRAFLSPDARDRNKRNSAMARAALGDALYDAAWQAGCALSIEQVIVEALAVERSPASGA